MVQDVIEGALTRVNQARRALHWPTIASLPRGNMMTACACPIARALSRGPIDAMVSASGVLFVSDGDPWGPREKVAKAWGTGVNRGDRVINPPEIERFVRAFDQGALRELVK